MNSYPGIDSANMEADSYSYNAVGWSTTGGTDGRFTTTTYWSTNWSTSLSRVRGYWGGTRDGPTSSSGYIETDYTNGNFDSNSFETIEVIGYVEDFYSVNEPILSGGVGPYFIGNFPNTNEGLHLNILYPDEFIPSQHCLLYTSPSPRD